jgi:hypothetical protein
MPVAVSVAVSSAASCSLEAEFPPQAARKNIKNMPAIVWTNRFFILNAF